MNDIDLLNPCVKKPDATSIMLVNHKFGKNNPCQQSITNQSILLNFLYKKHRNRHTKFNKNDYEKIVKYNFFSNFVRKPQ